MPTIDVNGTGLEYTEQGAGEPVVFVHGGLNDPRAWTGQVPAFSSKYRLRQPELVRTLVLADPPVLPILGVSVPPRPMQLLELLLRDPRAAREVIRFGARGIGPPVRAFRRGDDERGLETFVTAALGREDYANLSADMQQQIHDNVEPFKAQLRVGFPAFDEDDARRISAPTLLVNGERGAPVLHEVTKRLHKLMPHAERIQIGDTSHLMYADDPEAFNHAVLTFLERHSRPSLTSA